MSRHAEQEADTGRPIPNQQNHRLILTGSAIREWKEQRLVQRIAGSGTYVPYG